MASNNYCKLARRWALCASLCLLPLAAQDSGYLTAGTPAKVSGKRNAVLQVKVPLTVRAGFHVNSNKPNEDYLIPLKLTWTDTGALQAAEVVYPKPSQEKYAFAPQPLSVYTGAFDLTANFRVKSDAAAGPGMALGKLRYQACNDRACFPPKTVEVKASYQIQ